MTRKELIKSYNDTLKNVYIEYHNVAPLYIPNFKFCVVNKNTKKCLAVFKNLDSAYNFAKYDDDKERI